MSEPQLKKRISIPSDLSSGERKLVARKVIEFIQDRTDSGRGVDGGKFPRYSKAYSESQEFEIAGKTRSDVNLQQTGDTIHSIELLSEGSGFITIGFEKGSSENDRATWLQASDNGVSRVFLGISDADLNTIVASVKKQRTDIDSKNREDVTQGAIAGVLKRLGL